MSGMKRTNLRRFCVAGLLILVAALAGFRGVGRWLVREDPLVHADVIFVLSGAMPTRAEEAGKVFAMGYAPEVWLSRPESPADELAKLGIQFVGEEEYNRQILIHQGVGETAIHILPDEVVNTEQEVQALASAMRSKGKGKIILVTSPQHTRRVGALWQKLVGDSPQAIVHAAREDSFDADHWWRNTRDVLSVVRETLGLVNVWAGLPVRPHAD
jgi:uncharacterized SAM-binding protein YcdF (DUF218 family)